MSSRGPVIALLLCLAAFLALAFGNIATTSPTFDEPFHLAAGYIQLTTGDHRVVPDHPPLYRQIAAIPLLWMDLWPARSEPDGRRAMNVLARSWEGLPFDARAAFQFSSTMFFGVRDARFGSPTTVALTPADYLNDPHAIFFRARTVMLFASGFLLAILVFCWSYELWGGWGAAWSALLFCFDPNFIAHSGVVTTDAGAAMLIFGAVYLFWRATRGHPFANGAAFALLFAAATIAKFSSILLLPILLLLLPWGKGAPRRALTIAAGVVAAFIALWAVYGFRFHASGTEMPSELPIRAWYRSAALVAQHPDGPPHGVPFPKSFDIGLEGQAILFAERHRLLPQPFLFGYSSMRAQSILRGGYLRGEYSDIGFPAYFLWTFVYKTPIVTILAILAAIVVAVRRRDRTVAFLVVPAVVYFGATLFSNLNIGHRHLLPMYPFLYVLSGILATTRFRRVLIAVAPLVVAGSLVVFAPWQPVVNRHLSYFNELAGGPERGPELLVDSNIDWGQDLPRLAAWMREHGDGEPLSLAYFGLSDPRAYGIRYVNLAPGYPLEPVVPPRAARAPGLVAVSVTSFHNPNTRDHEMWPRLLKHAQLAGRAGYSILIFRIEQPISDDGS